MHTVYWSFPSTSNNFLSPSRVPLLQRCLDFAQTRIHHTSGLSSNWRCVLLLDTVLCMFTNTLCTYKLFSSASESQWDPPAQRHPPSSRIQSKSIGHRPSCRIRRWTSSYSSVCDPCSCLISSSIRARNPSRCESRARLDKYGYDQTIPKQAHLLIKLSKVHFWTFSS